MSNGPDHGRKQSESESIYTFVPGRCLIWNGKINSDSDLFPQNTLDETYEITYVMCVSCSTMKDSYDDSHGQQSPIETVSLN
jgi:hypothetical protein